LLLLFLLMGSLVLGAGCDSSLISPSEAPQKYDQLVQQAIAEAEARPDTSFFWLRNTQNPQARSLMLELGVDYLRYDREADVLCAWTGEGLWPARGYVTAPASGTVPADSVGLACNIEGTCSVESATDQWRRFQCE
jgi:hypothetical protein